VESVGLDDLGIGPDRVGWSGAGSAVDAATRRPARTKGEIVVDAGDGGTRLAGFLAGGKFV
jgi:electron transfer flavoprotein beta subunit